MDGHPASIRWTPGVPQFSKTVRLKYSITTDHTYRIPFGASATLGGYRILSSFILRTRSRLLPHRLAILFLGERSSGEQRGGPSRLKKTFAGFYRATLDSRNWRPKITRNHEEDQQRQMVASPLSRKPARLSPAPPLVLSHRRTRRGGIHRRIKGYPSK